MSAPDWSAGLPAHLRGLSAAPSAGTCPDMPGHAQACLNTPDLALTFHPGLALTFHPDLALTFHPDLALTFHPGLFDIGQGAPTLSGYFLLNGGDEG